MRNEIHAGDIEIEVSEELLKRTIEEESATALEPDAEADAVMPIPLPTSKRP